MKKITFLFKFIIAAGFFAAVFTACTKEKQYSNRIIGSWEVTAVQKNGVNVGIEESKYPSYQFNKNGTFTRFKTTTAQNRLTTVTGKWTIRKQTYLDLAFDEEENGEGFSIPKLTKKELQLNNLRGTIETYRKK